jgi:hypothetical protein
MQEDYEIVYCRAEVRRNISFKTSYKPCKLVQALMLLSFILDVTRSNLIPITECPEWDFCGFPKSSGKNRDSLK